MPRRKAAVKREVLPDPLYGSNLVAKFINVVMRAGKKSIAERIVYDAITTFASRLAKEVKVSENQDDETGGGTGKSAKSPKGAKSGAFVSKSSRHSANSIEEVLELFQQSLTNVAPTVEVKSRRVGGATYQVPIDVAAPRREALAMRWVVKSATNRSEKTMALRLGAELHDAYLNRGASIKLRDDVHRMAKANQAFAHYRW